ISTRPRFVRFRGEADNQTGFDVAVGQSVVTPAANLSWRTCAARVSTDWRAGTALLVPRYLGKLAPPRGGDPPPSPAKETRRAPQGAPGQHDIGALPVTYSRRQLFANAAIASSRIEHFTV